MTDFNDLVFAARTLSGRVIKTIPGAEITLPAATTAEGLYKLGDITIDASDPTASAVNMGNGGGGTFDCNITGTLLATVAVGAPTVRVYLGVNATELNSLATSARTVVFPDASGTVILADVSGNASVSGDFTATTLVGHATGFPSRTGRLGFGLLTGARDFTFPDATGTIPLLSLAQSFAEVQVFAKGSVNGALTVAAILALPGAQVGQTVFARDCRAITGCDIATGNFVVEGAGVGTGAQVTFNGAGWVISGTNVAMSA